MKYFQLLCKALLNRQEKNHVQQHLSRIIRRAECFFESKGKDILLWGEEVKEIPGHIFLFTKSSGKNLKMVKCV